MLCLGLARYWPWTTDPKWTKGIGGWDQGLLGTFRDLNAGKPNQNYLLNLKNPKEWKFHHCFCEVLHL